MKEREGLRSPFIHITSDATRKLRCGLERAIVSRARMIEAMLGEEGEIFHLTST